MLLKEINKGENVNTVQLLIIDDEKNILTSLKTALSLEGFNVSVAGSGEIGLEKLKQEKTDLVMLDVKMPGIDGIETLRRIKKDYPGMPVVMMSGHGNIQTALDAIRNGAIDFVEKPLSTERLIVTIRNTLHIEELEKENIQLRCGDSSEIDIIGSGAGMREVVDNIKTVAPTTTTVMIRGENGTGKELVAKAIHFSSPLRDKPFIKVNCAAIPDDLIESELFGHVKGAFTGAMGARKGKFELANGGTIFLDEIGDMKLEMQSKLLRVLQEGEFEPVGGEQTIKVNVRVLSATNRNLEKMIAEEQFRQDLYYRLAVIPIQVPPLRERLEDIAELVTHFSRIICNDNNRSLVSFSEEAISKLKTHQWPGNVRELKNIVERLIILSKTSEISRKEITLVLPSMVAMPTSEVALHGKPLKDLVADFEKKAIEKALERNDSHVSNTARELGLERSHLYKKMKAYGVNPR